MAKQTPAQEPTSGSEIVTVSSQPGELVPGQQSQAQAIAFVQTPENIELLKKSLADSKTVLTDSELGIFLYQAQKTGLDPLARQIYVMKRDQGGVSFMTSIDGQRLVAQRTREYDGQTPPEWCGKDGKWREVWLEDDNPAAARVGVYRKGMREPIYAVATWKSYARYTNVWVNGKRTDQLKPMGVWGQMGDVMLAKCAEALALRKAFPQELSGLYTPEEMNNADDTPEPPRVMTARDALAEAGKALVEKGFSRDEALTIIAGIADVDDPSHLTGSNLGPVLEIVNREDAEALALYLPGNHDDDPGSDHDSTPEGETVETPPADEKTPAQAMADGDPEPPASFGRKEPEDEKDDPVEPAPRYVVPEYKKGSTDMARPEMVTLYRKWAKEYGITREADFVKFSKNAIGKDKPATFDDYLMALGVLAEELNAQGTLV